MKTASWRRLLRWWPPYWGAGIRVTELSDDFRHLMVEMPLRWYNRNYVGTHFGGSLYAMIDPFYMLMLMHNLGPDYLVWDQAAAIEFIKPGRGLVRARFEISEKQLAEIREATANGAKFLPTYPIDIVDDQEQVVARATKTLYVRRRRKP